MNYIFKFITVTAATLASAAAFAFPIASVGTEGQKVIVASTDHVIATYEGNSAGYSNDLYLGGLFIFNNHASAVGSTVDLGSFAIGTELVFSLHVNDTGDIFFTGDAARNVDNLFHARVDPNWQPGATLVSFEDLLGTPEGQYGYNDLSFSFTNTQVAAVPEAETYSMMLLGLGLMGVLARRNKRA